MTEFIIYSDIHHYKNPHNSYVCPDGANSWLFEQLKVVQRVFDYAKQHNVETVIFDGDLYESKDRIDFPTLNSVWRFYTQLAKEHRIIFNIGNHDYSTLDRQNSSLVTYSDNIQVIHAPTDIVFGDTLCRIVPHGMVEGNLGVPSSSPICLLFTHEVISDLRLGERSYSLKTTLKKEIFSDWTKVFNGHIHMPQEINNIINIGSTMQQDFGEAGESKRFIHYKDGEIISIPVTAPEFFIYPELTEELKDKIEDDDTNFYRIDIPPESLGDSIFQKYNVSFRVKRNTERKVRLKETKTDKEELFEYITIINPNDLNRKKLLKIGLELRGQV